MAKKPKENAPVAPIVSSTITLAMIAAASDVDPFFLYVPAEVSAEWLEKGYVETNPDMTDAAGAVATRITEAGKIAMNDKTTEDQTTAPVTNSNDAGTEFAIEWGEAPAEGRASPASSNAQKYPFDKLSAPRTNEDGSKQVSRFFIPATAERPKPWESLASTVSTAKARYARKIGEREYKATETVKDDAGKDVIGADGKPVKRTVTKMRDVNEFDRVFRITEGVQKNAEGVEIKGAWVSRTK